MRKIWILMLALMVTAITFEASAESPIDLSDYSTEFDWKVLYRRPEEHLGEKYIVQGKLPSIRTPKADGSYERVWLSLYDAYKVNEVILLWIDPLEFNLIEDDYVEAHITITGTGPQNPPFSQREVFHAHVEALTVYDKKGGSIVETYVQTVNADVGTAAE
jgi:hypothetical protein